jgi:hypothetical protein
MIVQVHACEITTTYTRITSAKIMDYSPIDSSIRSDFSPINTTFSRRSTGETGTDASSLNTSVAMTRDAVLPAYPQSLSQILSAMLHADPEVALKYADQGTRLAKMLKSVHKKPEAISQLATPENLKLLNDLAKDPDPIRHARILRILSHYAQMLHHIITNPDKQNIPPEVLTDGLSHIAFNNMTYQDTLPVILEAFDAHASQNTATDRSELDTKRLEAMSVIFARLIHQAANDLPSTKRLEAQLHTSFSKIENDLLLGTLDKTNAAHARALTKKFQQYTHLKDIEFEWNHGSRNELLLTYASFELNKITCARVPYNDSIRNAAFELMLKINRHEEEAEGTP